MKTNERLPVFTPRWLYRFSAFIEKLPISGWLLAFLLIAANGVLINVVAWSQGTFPFGETRIFLLIGGLYQIVFYAQWLFLTHRAVPAIHDFFQGSKKNSAQIETILSDFVSLPSPWGGLFFLIGAAIGAIGYYVALVPLLPLTAELLPAWFLFNAIISGGFYTLSLARIVRQSIIARRLYRELEIDLFNPAPLHALTRYSVTNIATLVLALYVVQLIAWPPLIISLFGIVYQLIGYCALVAFFFAQIFAVNQRMRGAKENLLTQLSKDIESVHNNVHKAVQKQAYGAVGKMQATVSTLRNEQEIIQRIPTWPWQPETLRNLLAPLLLPAMAYLIQRLLGSMLGF